MGNLGPCASSRDRVLLSSSDIGNGLYFCHGNSRDPGSNGMYLLKLMMTGGTPMTSWKPPKMSEKNTYSIYMYLPSNVI